MPFLSFLLTTAVSFAACGDSGQSAGSLCEPASHTFCRCPNGEAGTRTCLADGDAYDQCLVAPGTPCPSRTGGDQICTPGESFYCMCSDGSEGRRACAPDGSSFSGCDCSSAGGGGIGGGATGAGGGVTGTAPLYSPCAGDDECLSGTCRMRYCTENCAQIDDCDLAVAECVSHAGETVCRPICSSQADCVPYELPSQCGYTKAVDDWAVTVCADWGSALTFPPDGTSCQGDTDCHLGHDAVERICHYGQAVCDQGCHAHTDCPGAQLCDTSVEPGVCL